MDGASVGNKMKEKGTKSEREGLIRERDGWQKEGERPAEEERGKLTNHPTQRERNIAE